MNFICPEISGGNARQAIRDNLFVLTDENFGEAYVDSNASYVLAGTNETTAGLTYIYSPKKMAGLSINISDGMTARTLSTLATQFGLSSTVDSALTASYVFKGSSIYDAQSPVFFIVFTSEGLIFSPPKPLATSTHHGDIEESNVATVMKMDLSGDTTAYDRGMNTNYTLQPSAGYYTAAEANAIAQKRTALSNQILCSLGELKVNPFDTITYKGSIYVLISKLIQSDGSYLYQGVQVDKTSHITSGTFATYDAARALSADNADEATHATSADTAASATTAANATKWGGYAPAVITTTFPNVGAFRDIALPSGWDCDNTVILGGQVRESASTFRYSLNYTYSTYGLLARIFYTGGVYYLRLNNNWSTTYMNGQVCRVFIAKIF